MPQTYTANTSILPIPENVKRIVFTILGAGGGGEYVNRINGQATAGSSGGDTTFLGMTAGGGRGGGIGGRNAAGDGGVATTGIYDYSQSTVSSVVLTNGSRGTLWLGGAGASNNNGDINGSKSLLYARNGGNGTSDQVQYSSTVTHSFINAPPYYVGQIDNSPDISVQVMNPSVTDVPCGTYTWSRYYLITFNYPFDNASYTIRTSSPFPNSTAAGGSFSGFAQFGSKTRSSIGVWWCKYRISGNGTVNSYVNQFGITVTGQRSSLRGRGGGGGAEITGIIERADLEERGLLGINTSLVIGSAGRDNSNNSISPVASDGFPGGAYVYIEYLARATIEVKNNPTNTIVYGESAVIKWNAYGDIEWALVEPGISPQGANFNSERTVTPTVTTTYFVRAYGAIGGTAEAEVTLIVLQRPEGRLIGPTSIDYGSSVALSYEATDAVTSITLSPKFYFADGSTLEGSQYDVQLESGELVDSTTTYDLTPWGDTGPERIEFRMIMVGYGRLINGQTEYLEETVYLEIPVNIDRTPDLITIPETEAIKDENPVYSPLLTSQLKLLVDDIDIPVEIKSDYPVQVEIDDDNIWRDIERI